MFSIKKKKKNCFVNEECKCRNVVPIFCIYNRASKCLCSVLSRLSYYVPMFHYKGFNTYNFCKLVCTTYIFYM